MTEITLRIDREKFAFEVKRMSGGKLATPSSTLHFLGSQVVILAASVDAGADLNHERLAAYGIEVVQDLAEYAAAGDV
jgi:hypothetical protein